jgi:hypothetical protein
MIQVGHISVVVQSPISNGNVDTLNLSEKYLRFDHCKPHRVQLCKKIVVNLHFSVKCVVFMPNICTPSVHLDY